MSSRAQINESMGWKLYSYLEQFPQHYDMTFSVGPEKVVVKALSIILRVSSPVFEKEFKDHWDDGVVRDGEGILLPKFDPAAFKLFLKLMILDSWSVDALRALELPSNQLLHLLTICQKYEMKIAIRSLTELVQGFLKNFHEYVKTKDSLLLSRSQLKSILASDDLAMNESDLFNYACRWAEEQCRKQDMDVNGINMRKVLGKALYSIRFPVLSIVEFAKVMKRKGLLSADEISEIVEYIGRDESEGLNNTTKTLFKTEKRKESPIASTPTATTTTVDNTGASQFTSVPAGSSIISVAQVFPVVDTPFVCDGTLKQNQKIFMNMRITLRGLGFLGPIDADSFYDVTVRITGYSTHAVNITGRIEKRIFAQKSKTFYFIFDKPVVLEGTPPGSGYYQIEFSLKGPNTRSLQYKGGDTRITDDNNKFGINWNAPQLVELVYNTL